MISVCLLLLLFIFFFLIKLLYSTVYLAAQVSLFFLSSEQSSELCECVVCCRPQLKALTTSGEIPVFRIRLGFWPAVLPEGLLFRDVGEKVDEWRHQDVCGVHDLVAHDDFGEGHAVQLLLSVRLN